jgi:hypothetical protein
MPMSSTSSITAFFDPPILWLNEMSGEQLIRRLMLTLPILRPDIPGDGFTILRVATNWFWTRRMLDQCKLRCAGWATIAALSMAYFHQK